MDKGESIVAYIISLFVLIIVFNIVEFIGAIIVNGDWIFIVSANLFMILMIVLSALYLVCVEKKK